MFIIDFFKSLAGIPKTGVYSVGPNSFAELLKQFDQPSKEKTQEEIIQFVENLPKSMFDKITSFFDKLPYIVYEDEFITPKGKKIPIVIRDFNNFFR